MRTSKSWVLFVLAAVVAAMGQQPSPEATLTVKTITGQTLTMGPQELGKLPPAHISATDHDGKKHEYAGVNLRDLLASAGVSTGSSLRGREMAVYVVAEGSDGYRVVFSLGGSTQTSAIPR